MTRLSVSHRADAFPVRQAHRTFAEAPDGEEPADFLQAEGVVDGMVRRYNDERLHSALGFLRPANVYRGDPEALRAERRRKLALARHRRRERNRASGSRRCPLTTGRSLLILTAFCAIAVEIFQRH